MLSANIYTILLQISFINILVMCLKNNLLVNIFIIFLKCFGGNIAKTMCIKCSENINIFLLSCGILSI